MDLMSSIPGTDYYIRIKDVLDRINKRENAEEATAADRHRRAISKPKPTPRPIAKIEDDDDRKYHKEEETTTPSKHQQRRKVVTPQKPASPDVSWKDGRKHFPKKSSQIGEEYQATKIPAAGTFDVVNNPSEY